MKPLNRNIIWGITYSLLVMLQLNNSMAEVDVKHAVNPPVHQYIADKAVELLTGQARAEFELYIGEVRHYTDGDHWNGTSICEGADEEDDDIFFNRDAPTYMNHFWDPDGGYDNGLYFASYQYYSAVERAEWYWDLALSYYETGEKASAYYWLGHIAHLLTDMSVPAHTHMDIHPNLLQIGYDDDNYELFMGSHYLDYSHNSLPILDYQSLPLTPPTCGTNYDTIQQQQGWNAAQTSLFRIFVNLAEVTDDFDSDDIMGEVTQGSLNGDHDDDDGFGEIDDTGCDFIGDSLMPASMQYVATLYQLFWDTTRPSHCVAIPVDTWTFETSPEGWSYRTAWPPPDIPDWDHATSAQVTTPGAIGLVAPVDETTDFYGSWDNYSGSPDIPAIAWVDNSVWRAVFTMSTDKADANSVPSTRLRFALNHMKATSYIQVLPGGWLPVAERGIGTSDYKLYLRPPIVDNGFFLAFDMIDFGQPFGVACDGIVYLEEVVVERFDLAEPCFDDYWTTVTIYAGSGLHSWTHSSAGVPYLTDVDSYTTTIDGLEQTTTMAQTRAFGAWTSPAEVDIVTTPQLYRAVWNLACEDSTLGGAQRVRLHTIDFHYSSYMVIDRDANPANSALPPTTGQDYYIYAEFPATPTVDNLLLAWDLYDFDHNAGGWAKLTDLVVSRRDLP